jgi:hypothetical protein
MANTNDFDATFLALKKVLKPYERRLVIQADSENNILPHHQTHHEEQAAAMVRGCAQGQGLR